MRREPGARPAWQALMADGRHRTTRLLLLAAALIDAAFPAIVVVFDATATQLDPWRHTLSRHAQVPGFPWMAVAFTAHGLAMALLAVALRRLPPRPWAGPTALWIGAGASLLLAFFPADTGGPATLRGDLHDAVAPVAFMAVAAAALLSWNDQRRSGAWQGLNTAPRLFAFLLAAALSGFGLLLAVVQFTDPPRIVLGASERLVVVGIAGWVLAEAVQAARVAGREPAGSVGE